MFALVILNIDPMCISNEQNHIDSRFTPLYNQHNTIHVYH